MRIGWRNIGGGGGIEGAEEEGRNGGDRRERKQ